MRNVLTPGTILAHMDAHSCQGRRHKHRPHATPTRHHPRQGRRHEYRPYAPQPRHTHARATPLQRPYAPPSRQYSFQYLPHAYLRESFHRGSRSTLLMALALRVPPREGKGPHFILHTPPSQATPSRRHAEARRLRFPLRRSTSYSLTPWPTPYAPPVRLPTTPTVTHGRHG